MVLEKAVKSKDYSYVVDALFDTIRYGWEGMCNSKFFTMTPIPKDLPPFERQQPKHRGSSSQSGAVYLNSGECLGTIQIEYAVNNDI